MVPSKAIPYPECHASSEAYIDSLLALVTSSTTLQTLCGGVHVLDFFTQTPDLYSTILEPDWREWIDAVETTQLLDLLMREDVEGLLAILSNRELGGILRQDSLSWRGGPFPPQSLLLYVQTVRQHMLLRDFDHRKAPPSAPLKRQVSAGMNVKKAHEVERFAAFLDKLTSELSRSATLPITHIVDFGSGQNYLGRALASSPYDKQVIALESKRHNIEGAISMDIGAKLAEKQMVPRNKKAFRNQIYGDSFPIKPSSIDGGSVLKTVSEARDLQGPVSETTEHIRSHPKIQYLQHVIQDGNLHDVVSEVQNRREPSLMVVSLHSCGNLVHHGLRSLLLNPGVRAVAMVGCCYNLMTERLGPMTWKLPILRPGHPRLDKTGTAHDPHGFPMSQRLGTYQHGGVEGIQFNITARMMAVQAPQNWNETTSEAFFTRHYYRALLQRIFFDRGLLQPVDGCKGVDGEAKSSSSPTQPIVIGSLRKACYTSFAEYVHGAVAKVSANSDYGGKFGESMAGLSNQDIAGYDATYRPRKKQLSALWSLMAFTAGVVESTIVVDRWCFLREQEAVQDAWVETVFEYEWSPRNLVVVGVKQTSGAIIGLASFHHSASALRSHWARFARVAYRHVVVVVLGPTSRHEKSDDAERGRQVERAADSQAGHTPRRDRADQRSRKLLRPITASLNPTRSSAKQTVDTRYTRGSVATKESLDHTPSLFRRR